MKSENFGIAVAEAMAHGLPVTTTHGAPWELLEEERCGWWVQGEGDVPDCVRQFGMERVHSER